MICPLRNSHHRIFTVMAIVLPAVLAGAIAIQVNLPKTVPTTLKTGTVLFESADSWSNHAINTRVIQSGGELYLHLVATQPLAEPDVVVLLEAEPDQLDNAQLLGSLYKSSSFPIPPDTKSPMSIALYSVAYSRLIDRATIPATIPATLPSTLPATLPSTLKVKP
jgi:hypothetical protein